MVAVKRQYESGDDELYIDAAPPVHVLSLEEGREVFDEQARKELGISGDEFLRRWDAGEFWPISDTEEGRKVGRMAMLMTLVRERAG
jgi:hypothetical protein